MKGKDAIGPEKVQSMTRRTAIKSLAGVVSLGTGALAFSEQASATFEGRCQLKNKNSGKSLEVADWGTSNGDNVQQWGYQFNNNQEWKMYRVGTDIINGQGYPIYTIENAHSGKNLGVSGGGTSNGDNVIQWEPNGSDSQKWVGIGTTFRNFKSRKNLGVSGGGTSNGDNAIQWEPNGNDSQKWQWITRA